MLTTTHKMLKNALDGQYAVAAINTQGGNYDIIRACCMAAQEMNSPIILAHYLSTGAYSGHDWFFETAKWLAEKVDVPVAIHLDHGDSFEHCMQMLQIGFTSIMYDGSAQSIEDNARNTKEIAKVCHAFGVPVEAEVGELVRLDGDPSQTSNVVDPELVKQFLTLCNPDSLALGIGNAHGYYKSVPNIRVDVLKTCRTFTDIPFVLHGCTGMTHEQIRSSIDYGVAKINFGTHIRNQYLKYLKSGLEQGSDDGHAWKLSKHAEELLRDDIKEIICVSGSENKI